MWPWRHAAVGYLLLSLACRWGSDASPRGRSVFVTGIAALLPDLIDKPLAWTWTVLPNGRSLGHSALTGTVICAGLWVLFRKTDRRYLVGAFAIGYWSHLLSDGLESIGSWQLHELAYLGYPLLPPVTYETDKSFLAHLRALQPDPLFGLELLLVVLALLVWRRDGYPGLELLGVRIR